MTLLAIAAGAAWLTAGEGMWTFDNPPTTLLKDKYGFELTPAWLEHVRLSSVRFNDGGSGSFVSATGLVLTNHHVALGQLQKVSTAEKNYVVTGFLARNPAEEIKCPDLELNVLMSMENVTDRVAAAVKPGMGLSEANEARKAAIAGIEKAGLEATGLRSDVVILYEGGEYWLYQYKKYTDVRLVFAPEQTIAYFGGDPDNFTFPRYNLDMALFRVYENDKPLSPKHFLKWDPKGSGDGDLVFVSGHPGRTSRLNTLAELEFQRDLAYPQRLDMMNKMVAAARVYAAQGPEQARQAMNIIYGIENALKATTGEYQGLINPELLAKKAREEAEFRKLVDSNPEWKQAYAGAWEELAQVQKLLRQRFNEITYRTLPRSRLLQTALSLVQMVAETAKPDSQRLDGYHDAQLESLKFRLFSPAPVYPGMEEVLMAFQMKLSLSKLGEKDAFMAAMLDGKTPEAQAKALVSGTKLADPAFRMELFKGGAKAVAESTDPLIVLARKVDPLLREIQKWKEDHVESVETSAGEKIGKARFAVYGKNAYPDATFTLRLSYGVVQGYAMNGTQAPSKTTFYGLYERSAAFDNKTPFRLPERYAEALGKLDLATPFNFVCTADIIGGNSGSPVISGDGNLVGLVFDGNIESLVGRFVFDETANRCVSVHTAGMTEALKKVYEAGELLRELLGQ
ncbi:MAG: S46 family peptidase [Acidobacteria bacterium]|nr:S46 family peptidase [Acidobacteriota bacterium]